MFTCTYELEVISVAGNSVCASDVQAASAKGIFRSVFITSPSPARIQPRTAKIPKPAMDVDAFLKVNATDITPLTLRDYKKGFHKKGSLLIVLSSCFAQRMESKVLKDFAAVFTSLCR